MNLLDKYFDEMDAEILADESRIVRYIESREDGASPRWAGIVACQRGPNITGTDTLLQRGRTNGNQFADCPWVGDAYKKIAERMAPGCTTGAYYTRQLARFPGDPAAWIRTTGDMKKAAELKGADIDDGIVKYKCKREFAPKNPVPLADDIVQDHLRRRAAVDPTIKTDKKRRKKAIEDIYNRHTPNHKKKFLKG